MALLVDLGFIPDRPWIEGNKEDDELLRKIHKASVEQTHHQIGTFAKWTEDKAPMFNDPKG